VRLVKIENLAAPAPLGQESPGTACPFLSGSGQRSLPQAEAKAASGTLERGGNTDAPVTASKGAETGCGGQTQSEAGEGYDVVLDLGGVVSHC